MENHELRRISIKTIANYVRGKPKTEVRTTGNDIYYDGTIYRLPEGPFEAVVFENNVEKHPIVFWNDEPVVWVFTDNPEETGEREREFDEIPEAYYEARPVVEVEGDNSDE